MFRRHLNFSSHPHEKTASLWYIACFSSSRKWCTPCSSVSAADVGWDRTLPLFWRGEKHRFATLSVPPLSATLLPTALCSARRWYVYQPPGTREPNMPWFRSGASSSASTSLSRHNSPGSKSSPSKPASPPASSKPIPPPSPSHHATKDAAAVGGEDSLRYAASPTRGETSGSVPPSVGLASLTSSGASSASMTALPSRGGAGEAFSPSGQSAPRASASPMSSTSSLWGTGASLSPAPPPPSSSTSHAPSHPSFFPPSRDAVMGGGTAPQVPPPSPRVSPIPASPVVPLWTGPLELRTPLEYILQRHDSEHGERSDRQDGEDERNSGKRSSFDPGEPQRIPPAAADTMLHDLAALLIDPVAQNTVERIALRTFASMQPKRQLLALQGNKEWWEWIVASAPYREVVEKMRNPLHTAAAETTLKQDRRILKEAGLRTLQDWVEHQHLVIMSPQTKSALDAAVTITVQQHVSQVLSVVKQCHSVRHLLRRWLSDVVGKFILDSLALSVEAAAVSVQKARGARWSTRKGLFAPPSSAEKADMDDYAALEEDEAMNEEDTAMAVMMMKGTGSSSSSSAVGGAAKSPLSTAKKHPKKPMDKRADPSHHTASPLRAGEVCTVEHYLMFLQKVTASVRQDRWKHENSSRSLGANRNTGREGNLGNNGVGTTSAAETSQDECEVQERTKAIVASAFSHLLQHAMQLYLPAELRELADGGYLALERVPVLLQRAASQLHLRTLPVGYFILHSTTQDKKSSSSSPSSGYRRGGRAAEGRQGNENAFFPPDLPLFPEGTDDVIADVVHPLTESVPSVGTHDFAREETGESTLPGAFLTDEEDPSIPLMIWKRPRRALLSGRGGGNGTPPHACLTPGTPFPSTHSHSSGRATLYDGESLQESYYSMLFHLQSALEKLSFTTIEELFDDADSLSGCPQSTVWNASSSDKSAASSPLAWSSATSSSGGVCCSSSLLSAIFGDDPLFGSAKLVEDQLTTAVSVPPSASSVERPPLYFVEAGANCGKTALLERLQQRLRPQEVIRFPPTGSGGGSGRFLLSSVSLPGPSPSRGGAVLIRYQSATTPFIPDLDDHPMAFAARFWFRVVLSTMPYFTRSELLFSRAPTSSPLWWSNQPHQLHWSYHTMAQSGAIPANSMPSSVLVDDIHQVLDSMESKWARVLFNARGEPVPAERVRKAFDVAVQMEEEEEEEERKRRERSQWLEGSAEKKWTEPRGRAGGAGEAPPPSSHSEADAPAQHRQAQRRREQQYQELTRLLSSQSLLEIPLTANTAGQDSSSDGHAFLGASSVSAGAGSCWPVVGDGDSGAGVGGGGTRGRMSATLFAASRRQQAAEALQRRTGHSMGEMLSTCMLHITAGLSDTHLVFAGQRVSPLLLAYGGGTRVVRQFHLPVLRPGSMNWQQRVRVLPPLAVLQALHRRAGREMPGILYEVIKNSPAFIGSTLELLWSATGSRHSSTGAPGSPSAQRSYLTLEGSTNSSSSSSSTSPSSHGSSNALGVTTGVGGGGGLAERRGAAVGACSSYLLQQLSLKPYDAQSLFLELPLRNRLLCHPQHACHRLVQLLQLQLCSPNGYLTTLVDTTLEDAEMGLVMPHSHTFSQVHPFALFILFSHQAALPPSLSSPPTSSSSLTLSKKKALHAHRQTAGEAEKEVVDTEELAAVVTSGENGPVAQQVMQAWTEVWAEYTETVQCMATTPRRKKEALRVLLHGALLLRAAALSRTEMNLNAAVPSYGFPLLASDIRVRPGRQHPSAVTASFGGLRRHQQKEQVLDICPASPDTVRRAAAAYQQFFAHAIPSHSHFAFRPIVGLNAGCDVVLVSGHTLYLYDIAISSYHLGQVIQRRFAEALLGILHLFEKQILSRDRIHQVQYVTVVCCDQEEEPAYYRYGDVDGIMGNNVVTGATARQDGGGRPLLSRSYQSLFTSSSYAGASSSSLGGGGSRWGGEPDGERTFRTPLSSEDAASSFALQRPDNVGAAVPLILDYSALLDDDTMDLLQYLRREVLQIGVRKEDLRREEKKSGPFQADAIVEVEDEEEARSARSPTAPPCTEEVFRTVQDLLDALEQQFRLPVRQRVLSTFEELEGLFSPTLLQLIPDSMLLPPFTPAVVSSEDLLQEVFQQQQEEENAIESDIGGGGAIFLNATAAASARQSGAEWEDVQQDHFLAQEQVAQGHPSSSSPENPFLADQELLESTELLEAMMNDGEEELEEAMSHRSGGMEEEEVGAEYRAREEGEPQRATTPSSASEAVAGGQRVPVTHPASSPPAAVDHSFSWLQHAIPRAPSTVGSPAFPFGADTGATDIAATAQHAPSPSPSFSAPPFPLSAPGAAASPPVGGGPPPSLPFPYSAATPMATEAQAAQDLLFTGGYNTAALPTQDPLEEMDRERGRRREEGVRNGDERSPPAAGDPTASTLAQEGNDDEDWEEDEDMDEELEEGEDEGDLPLHEKKSKTAGRAGREKKARSTRSGREGGRTKASVEENGDGGESELNALLRKSEGGAVLSTGERRRLRRLRRRRLAAAASGGKEQKLTVSAALRLRQQQKKGTGEKKSGVSSITGLSYDEEARFLERFLADERRRHQPQQRGRAVIPFSAEPIQRKGSGVEASKKKKKKLLKKIISKIGAKKVTSTGSSSSSSKSRKKVVRSSKPFSARRPVRRPKRLKRA